MYDRPLTKEVSLILKMDAIRLWKNDVGELFVANDTLLDHKKNRVDIITI